MQTLLLCKINYQNVTNHEEKYIKIIAEVVSVSEIMLPNHFLYFLLLL